MGPGVGATVGDGVPVGGVPFNHGSSDSHCTDGTIVCEKHSERHTELLTDVNFATHLALSALAVLAAIRVDGAGPFPKRGAAAQLSVREP